MSSSKAAINRIFMGKSFTRKKKNGAIKLQNCLVCKLIKYQIADAAPLRRRQQQHHHHSSVVSLYDLLRCIHYNFIPIPRS